MFYIFQVFYNPFDNPENPFGSAEAVYDFISCWKSEEGETGNQDGSYLTFYSSGYTTCTHYFHLVITSPKL